VAQRAQQTAIKISPVSRQRIFTLKKLVGEKCGQPRPTKIKKRSGLFAALNEWKDDVFTCCFHSKLKGR